MSDTEDETSTSGSSSSEESTDSSSSDDSHNYRVAKLKLAQRRKEKREKKKQQEQFDELGNVVVVGAYPVITTQPALFTQGAWTRPDMCGLCFDSMCCYVGWCTPCARGEIAQRMGGDYGLAFVMCMFFPCFSCCTICGERDQIRMRFGIPKTDGCCTVCWCFNCVLAQHLYQLRGIPQPIFYQ